MPDMRYIGVSSATKATAFCVALIDEGRQTAIVREIDLGETTFDAMARMLERREWPPQLESAREWLLAFVSESQPVQTVVAVPSMFLDMDNVMARALLLLTGASAGALFYAEIPEHRKIVLAVDRPVLDRSTPRLPKPFWYIYNDALAAYADLLFGQTLNSRAIALLAAVLGKYSAVYFYLTSGGEVQSSQDVVEFLRARETYAELGMPPHVEIVHGVISHLEEYSLRRKNEPLPRELSSLPRKYAVAAKRNDALGEQHSRKFGLLAVCRDWEIQLSCRSLRDDIAAQRLFAATSTPTADEGEDDNAPLRDFLIQNYLHSDIAEGSEAAFLIVLHKHLREQGVFPHELELRLFRLLPRSTESDEVVLTSADGLPQWIVNDFAELRDEK